MGFKMDYLLQYLDMSQTQWIVIIAAAFLVGFSKTGISGLMLLAIPIMASIFGAKDSTGIILPMLLVGDVFAVIYYRKNVEWKNIRILLPWALTGLAVGAVIGGFIDDGTFKIMIGSLVLLCLGLLVFIEKKGPDFRVPHKAWFYITVGILAGFSTMIGNAAGPIFSVYLLALGFRKTSYMGTNAWFFFIINFLKVPLQVFVWHNIDFKSAVLTASMIPVITIGAVLGFWVIKKINEKFFRYLIIVMTTISAFRLLFS